MQLWGAGMPTTWHRDAGNEAQRCQERSIPRKTFPFAGVVRPGMHPCDPCDWSVRPTVMLAGGGDRSARQQCTGRVHGIQLKSDSANSHRVLIYHHSSDYGIQVSFQSLNGYQVVQSRSCSLQHSLTSSPVPAVQVHVLVSKSRSLQNRGPYIHYYVDEDRDLAIHNVLIPTIYTYILMNI